VVFHSKGVHLYPAHWALFFRVGLPDMFLQPQLAVEDLIAVSTLNGVVSVIVPQVVAVVLLGHAFAAQIADSDLGIFCRLELFIVHSFHMIVQHVLVEKLLSTLVTTIDC